MTKSDKIPVAVRQAVWNTYIGEEKGVSKCFIGCGTSISQATFHCGHVIPRSKGGPVTIQNLRPICQRCNTSMGSVNMYDFCEQYGFKNCKLSWKEYQELLKTCSNKSIIEKRCEGVTKKGKQCSLNVAPGHTKYCHIHNKVPTSKISKKSNTSIKKEDPNNAITDVLWSMFKLYIK